jgi:hypothetical protein
MHEEHMAKAVKVRLAGEHYTDIHLWQTANYLLEIGVRRKNGGFHPLLASSVFALFAFEAFLNEVGRQLDSEVWSREREFFSTGTYRGTLGKLRYLAEKTDFAYRLDVRPFQTIRALATVRDTLAHGRTEAFDVETTVTRAESLHQAPKLRQWGQVLFARRAVADIEQIADGLMAAAKTKFGEWAAGYRSSAFYGAQGVRSTHLLD